MKYERGIAPPPIILNSDFHDFLTPESRRTLRSVGGGTSFEP